MARHRYSLPPRTVVAVPSTSESVHRDTASSEKSFETVDGCLSATIDVRTVENRLRERSVTFGHIEDQPLPREGLDAPQSATPACSTDTTIRDRSTVDISDSPAPFTASHHRLDPTCRSSPLQNRSSDAWPCHLWEALDDEDLESTASQLFWQDPTAASSGKSVINYSLPRRIDPNSHTRQSCSSASTAMTCVVDHVVGAGCRSEYNTLRPVSSNVESNFFPSHSSHSPRPEWEVFGPSDVAQPFVDKALTAKDGQSDGTVPNARIIGDDSWAPRPPLMHRLHPSFASDQTICEQSNINPISKEGTYSDEATVYRSTRRESEGWPPHLQASFGS